VAWQGNSSLKNAPVECDQKWTHCYTTRVNKKKFYMHQDGKQNKGKFLLSAKLENGTFYISQYEDFPEVTNGVPRSRFVAVLRPDMTTRSYKLFLCGCEDPETYFQLEKHTAFADEEKIDGQLLADIAHSTKLVPRADAEMRAITIAIPAVQKDTKCRAIWSPRTTKKSRSLFDRQHSGVRSGNVGVSSSMSVSSSSGSDSCASSDSGCSDDFDQHFSSLLLEDTIALESKLPEWNDSIQSLVLKFTGGRVVGASAKNFLIADKKNMDHPILQFGKAAKSKYVVDFRAPIAPIQAFAVFLSATAWVGKN